MELRDGLGKAGLTVLTFNYLYSEAGRKSPDAQPLLLGAHRAARDHLEAEVGGSVVLAGRSMGGRMGTYLAAAGEPALGLVLYAYPLHPPGKPDKLRADHLPAITAPMLFFQGTRDPLSRMELFDRYVRPLPERDGGIARGGSFARWGKERSPDDRADSRVDRKAGVLIDGNSEPLFALWLRQ